MASLSALNGCAFCLKIPTEDTRLLRCKRCTASQYCDSICQRSDWPLHKMYCSQSTKGAMPGPLHRWSDHHQQSLRLGIGHAVADAYGVNVESLNYDEFFVVIDAEHREGPPQSISPARRFTVCDISVHPMSQWDDCLAMFPSLAGRASFMQCFRRMEHDKQLKNVQGGLRKVLGTVTVVLKAAHSSAMVMYESLFRQALPRMPQQSSIFMQPNPSKGEWREALKTMVHNGHYPWPRTPPLGGWECVEDSWDAKEKRWIKKPVPVMDQLRQSYLPGTVGSALVLMPQQKREEVLDIAAINPAVREEAFWISLLPLVGRHEVAGSVVDS